MEWDNWKQGSEKASWCIQRLSETGVPSPGEEKFDVKEESSRAPIRRDREESESIFTDKTEVSKVVERRDQELENTEKTEDHSSPMCEAHLIEPKEISELNVIFLPFKYIVPYKSKEM